MEIPAREVAIIAVSMVMMAIASWGPPVLTVDVVDLSWADLADWAIEASKLSPPTDNMLTKVKHFQLSQRFPVAISRYRVALNDACGDGLACSRNIAGDEYGGIAT